MRAKFITPRYADSEQPVGVEVRTSLLVQRSGVQLPGRSNQITLSPTAATLFSSSKLCCPGAKPRRWARHSLHARRNNTSIMKIFALP